MKFSKPKYSSGKRELSQIVFGGYNHTLSAQEGEIYDMNNLTAEHYPILSTRRPKILVAGSETEESPPQRTGAYIYDDNMFLIEVPTYTGGGVRLVVLSLAGVRYHDILLSDKEGDIRKRSFAAISDYLIILPDKKYIKLSEIRQDTFKLYDMEVSISQIVTIGDGKYGGVDAKANTITFPEGTDLSCFSVGDAVTISGCIVAENNKTPIIEEIDGNKLVFLEYTFTVPEEEAEYTEGSVTVARLVPDLLYICEQDNRLFGCDTHQTIYASKAGNPFVWYNYEGYSGAWSVNVISPGLFTGCVSYGGNVLFFKENCIYKLYGTRPSNFQLSKVEAFGIRDGCKDTVSIVAGTLFYFSPIGIMAYNGGYPRLISEVFGNEKLYGEAGGTDGVNYYVCLYSVDTHSYYLFCYDTQKKIWMKEDLKDGPDGQIIAILFSERLHFIHKRIWIYALGEEWGYDVGVESNFESYAEFGDFYTSLDKKVISKLYGRFELEKGSQVRVLIKFDDGEWECVATLLADKKTTKTIPIIPRRCDHYRIKIEGVGYWKLYELSREGYIGSKK